VDWWCVRAPAGFRFHHPGRPDCQQGGLSGQADLEPGRRH